MTEQRPAAGDLEIGPDGNIVIRKPVDMTGYGMPPWPTPPVTDVAWLQKIVTDAVAVVNGHAAQMDVRLLLDVTDQKVRIEMSDQELKKHFVDALNAQCRGIRFTGS